MTSAAVVVTLALVAVLSAEVNEQRCSQRQSREFMAVNIVQQ